MASRAWVWGQLCPQPALCFGLDSMRQGHRDQVPDVWAPEAQS